MLTDPILQLKVERAAFARDVEYLKETSLDDMIDDRLDVVSDLCEPETTHELEEAVYMVNRLGSDENYIEENAEIDRILNSEDDCLTFNEMIGIE